MTANAPKIYDLAVEDIEYLRHGDTSLLARLFKDLETKPPNDFCQCLSNQVIAYA